MSYTLPSHDDCPVSRAQAARGVAYYAALERFLERPTVATRAAMLGAARAAGRLNRDGMQAIRADVASRAQALGKLCPQI